MRRSAILAFFLPLLGGCPLGAQTVTMPATFTGAPDTLYTIAVSFDGEDFAFIFPKALTVKREYSKEAGKLNLLLQAHWEGEYYVSGVCCKGGKLSEFSTCRVTIKAAVPMPPAPGPAATEVYIPGDAIYRPALPAGAERYEPTRYTQEIATTNGRPRISQVPISGISSKWHQSGGMEGINPKLWTSEKYRLRPPGSKTWLGTIQVKNSFGFFQGELGIKQEYADGTEFHDVLRNADGRVFEHRARMKRDGKWKSSVVYSDPDARPKGYTGLKMTCAECHNQAGTGNYAKGLVPGGDTVISESLAWELVNR